MSDAKEKKSFLDSFKITDRESCAQTIKNGGIAAMISAGLTGALAAYGFFNPPTGNEFSYFDPWSLIDAVLILVLGLLIFRKSRIAATLMVVYFVWAKITIWSQSGQASGALVAVIFFLYYANAMRGTYIWYSTYKTESSLPA